MRQNHVACVIALCFLIFNCATAPKLAPKNSVELNEIDSLEQRRSLGHGKLESLAVISPDAQVRQRALLALARIQDFSSLSTLVKGLKDSDASVRSEAAFAIGLLGQSWRALTPAEKESLAQPLLVHETIETNTQVKISVLESMGKIPTAQTVSRLVERLNGSPELKSTAALALGISAKLDGTLFPLPAIKALESLGAGVEEVPTRYGAAYALMQSKRVEAHSALVKCAADLSSEVRALCAKGLGDAGNESDVPLLTRLMDDADHRVSVEAIRSLAKQAVKCKSSCAASKSFESLTPRIERLIRGDSAGGGHPLLALAQAPLPVFSLTELRSLRAAIQLKNGEAVASAKHDVANIDCRLAAAVDRLSGTIEQSKTCGFGLIPEAQRLSWALNELSTVPAADACKRAAEISAYTSHASKLVQLAALNGLAETKCQISIDALKTQLNNPDGVLASTAAAGLAKLEDKTSIEEIRALAKRLSNKPELLPVLAESLSTLDAKEAVIDLTPWLQSTHLNVRQSAADALTKLLGKTIDVPRVDRQLFIVEKSQSLAQNAQLNVHTSKGDFVISLFTQEAPHTSLNLYALAKQHFFKNLTFHRIVPDFVAQGGDPRGDGEGGPGYDLACEINHQKYQRGTVGMALSGKDTGGSQFFINLASTPHLDGRYTTFGRVTKGQEVVDGLLEGDLIVDIVPLESK
jgi:cyclophilin family peptidyl-prolyl cis-trans isomerase/HEAT repeat protein